MSNFILRNFTPFLAFCTERGTFVRDISRSLMHFGRSRSPSLPFSFSEIERRHARKASSEALGVQGKDLPESKQDKSYNLLTELIN